ncbi:MAG: polyphosphate kinase 1 [Chloroflexi bacterium]|nr:polyphosphate kinase 1 [Chloroflexota bacterium]
MTTIQRPSRRRAASRIAGRLPYLNRELSWLEFNARVLHEAEDERNPLLERTRFLAIFASNLDEFFQVRVAGLQQQVAAGRSWPSADGMTAPQILEHIRDRVLQLQAAHSVAHLRIRDQLADEGIRILPYAERPERRLELRQRFLDEIFPVLTPLAVDPSHPFPYISDLSLSLAVTVRDPLAGEDRFARIKVPPVLPRLWEVGVRTFVLVEQIIAANLDTLFPGMEIVDHHLFRVTRNADISIEEDEADDLLLAIEEELSRRRFGKVVRLEVERSMPWATRALLQKGLGLEAADVYEIAGMLDLRELTTIADLDVPELQSRPWHPLQPASLKSLDDEEPDMFAAIRAGDLLVHHPYESFSGSVQRFIEQAAEDPDVLSIKMTLYRTSGDSAIVRALIDAAERGKQVVAMVELKARFDERANIVWARALERAGAHVAYGLVGLKTHCKAALVVRREGRGLRSYVHVGTGNYNPKTARVYTDLGLLSDDSSLTADITDLFNVLTGVARKERYRRLLVAPVSLRSGILALIEGEAERQRTDGDGRIVLKVNSIVDPGIIGALYTASQAGVPIDLIVRGMCSVVPGVPKVSETIAVRSVIGRFLEHSRILCFGQGEREQFLIGSADMMERNLDRRVEALVPVTEPALQDRLRVILQTLLRDDRRAWSLDREGDWKRVETLTSKPAGFDTFETLMLLASIGPEPLAQVTT